MPKQVGSEQSGGVLGLAGNIASMIPGMGAATGLLGIGGNVLSWILGSDKYDWEKWKKEQMGEIDANYNKSLGNATQTAIKTANSTIGEATTKQGMAGGVSGINGVGRLAASTYADVAGNRDSAVTGITNALEQNRAAMKSAVTREAASGSMQEDFNAPTTLDYINNLLGTLSTPVGQEGVGAIIGGLGKTGNVIGNLFKGKQGITNTGVGSGIDKGIGGNATGFGDNSPLQMTGKFGMVSQVPFSTSNISNSPYVMNYFKKNKQPFLF